MIKDVHCLSGVPTYISSSHYPGVCCSRIPPVCRSACCVHSCTSHQLFLVHQRRHWISYLWLRTLFMLLSVIIEVVSRGLYTIRCLSHRPILETHPNGVWNPVKANNLTYWAITALTLNSFSDEPKKKKFDIHGMTCQMRKRLKTLHYFSKCLVWPKSFV